MAKRKHVRGEGSKLRPIKDYRAPEYTMYIAQAETGILQAWAIDRSLSDGDVREGLRKLIAEIERANELPLILQDLEAKREKVDLGEEDNPFVPFILLGLQHAFKEAGSLPAEDVVGILRTINSSVGTWNIGLKQQGYLNYIAQFLGQLGVNPRLLSEDEVMELGLDQLDV
jgi:hypothetical protein